MTVIVLELLVDHRILEIILAEVEADIKMIKQEPGAVVELDMCLDLVEIPLDLHLPSVMARAGAMESRANSCM